MTPLEFIQAAGPTEYALFAFMGLNVLVSGSYLLLCALRKLRSSRSS